jgi:formylglycine-generating enzyme required for sulfatase activity
VIGDHGLEGTQAARTAGRRFFIAVGCADPGPNSRLRPLAGVPRDLERMQALFVQQLGYEPVLLGARGQPTNLDLSAGELQDGLHAWRLRAAPCPGDSVVFYYTGHGHTHGSVHYLCTRNFHARDPSSGLETRRLAQLLPHDVTRIWVLLDICRAGDGANAICEAVLRDRALYGGSIWVLAACGQAVALDQAFSAAFVRAALPFVRAGGCPSQDALARRVQRALGGKHALQRVQQSCYGSDGFDFLGARHLTTAWSTRASEVLVGYLGLRAPAKAAGEVSVRRPNDLQAESWRWPVPGRARRAAMLLVSLSVALLAMVPLLLSRWSAHAVQESALARGAQAARVVLAAGSAPLASSLHDARAAYAQCVARAECGMPFASSSFAAEVRPVGSVAVASFALARDEVTQHDFVAWLSSTRDEWRVERDGATEATISNRHQRVLARVGFGVPSEQTGIYTDGRALRVDATRSAEPVTQVSWYGADSYCRAQGGRLPSEPEWAYAARGKQGRTFPWGETPIQGCHTAVFGRRSDAECSGLPSRPSALGAESQDVTPEGVRDLAGNVAEWTSSLFAADSAQRTYVGCQEEDLAALRCHVVRGGSYWDSRLFLRGASRTALRAHAYWRGVGFRCAWDAPHP